MAARFRARFHVNVGEKGFDNVARVTHDCSTKTQALATAKRQAKRKNVTKIEIYERIHQENVKH